MVRSILTVLSGSIVAMVIGVVGLPILAQLYQPSDFGHFQVYVSGTNVLLMLVALRYELGLLSAGQGRDYASLLGVTFGLCLLTSAIVLVLSLALGPWLRVWYPQASPVLWLFGPGLLISGLYQTVTFLPMRYRDYRVSAEYKVLQSGSFVGLALGLAFLPLPGIGLVLADIAGRGAAALRILSRSPRQDLIAACATSPRAGMQALRRHVTLPIYTLPGSLISAIAAAMVPLAFVSLFNLEVAGQYSLVERFIITPVAAVGTALYQVYTGELSHAIRNEPASVHRHFRRMVAMTGTVAAIGGTIGWFVLPAVFNVVFGDRWVVAGQLAAVCMPLLAVSFVVTPVNMALLVAKARKTQLAWEVFRFATVAATYWLLHELHDLTPVEVMTIYSFVVAAVYLFYLFLADRTLAKLATEKIDADHGAN